MTFKQFNITIIGAGRVGTLLGVLFHEILKHKIIALISRSDESLSRFTKKVPVEIASKNLSDIPAETEIIFISTPDSEIKNIAEKISLLKKLNFQKLAIYHTSGALTSEILSPLAKLGAETGSLHPIYSVSHYDYALEEIKQIKFALEGTEKIYDITKWLFYNYDSNIITIDKSQKVLYHIACVFASNYIIALLNSINEILEIANFRNDFRILFPLTIATLKNAEKLGTVNSLTGPIERGDAETIKIHLDELSQKSPDILPLYASLAIETIKIAFKKKSINSETASKLLDLISSYITKTSGIEKQ